MCGTAGKIHTPNTKIVATDGCSDFWQYICNYKLQTREESVL